MGVKNLWDILESCKKILPLNHLQNKRVCIDLSCWMVQLQNVNKSYCAHRDKVYLRSLFHRLRALIALNCSLIFVTDGSIPAIKLATYRKRLNLGSEVGIVQVSQDENDLQKVSSLRRNMGSEFSCMIKEAKDIGLALGIPCLDGIEEAEAQCALLNAELLCDGCFTSDSDVFLFGARTVYRDIVIGEGGHVVCYEMADIERELGYGRNSLIALALLLGGDYSQGVHGLGRESACHIVKSVGENIILQQIRSEGLCFVKKTKTSKKQGQKQDAKAKTQDHEITANGSGQNSTEENPFLPVIDAYLNPKCHLADSEPVCRVLAQHQFKRDNLHQICTQFFEWPPEKTDEYILSKIAERDLRRFANLRSTSSRLGVRLPLDEVPVKCPVSQIVKPRKVQGRECFEVLWEVFDGLGSSVVAGDLIKSACPEKIADYEERKTLGKKQNRRNPKPKKTECKSALAEIDENLQGLMLEIEQGSISSNDSFYSRNGGPENVDSLVTADFNINELNDMMPCSKSGSAFTENEVIDLLSPSPMPCRTISRRKEGTSNNIHVIDLSDSETEISPEHQRKARELRQFLANIRSDLS